MAVFMKRERFLQPYIELDYIETTGTQYIDTGYNPNNTTKIIMDAQFNNYTSVTPIKAYFYCVDGSNRFGIIDASSSNNSIYFYYSNLGSKSWNVPINSRRTIVVDGASATIDGTTLSFSAKTYQINRPLFLFAGNENGVTKHQVDGKIFSCQIYDNGAIVRDYIPVQMRKTGEVGLWDKVNKQFYGNAGTGVFIGIKDNMPVDGIVLSYIESTGTQYIDTGFMPNQDTRVVLDADVPKNGSNVTYVFGVDEFIAGQYYQIRITSSGTVYGSDYGNEANKSTAVTPSGRTIFDRNKNITKVGDGTRTHTQTTFQCTAYLKLLAGVTTSGAHRMSPGKIYGCEIYDNGKKVRNYIPVKMKKSGEIGLWDKANNVFYPNAGTGEFIAGEIEA